jgi:hypothetical protein
VNRRRLLRHRVRRDGAHVQRRLAVRVPSPATQRSPRPCGRDSHRQTLSARAGVAHDPAVPAPERENTVGTDWHDSKHRYLIHYADGAAGTRYYDRPLEPGDEIADVRQAPSLERKGAGAKGPARVQTFVADGRVAVSLRCECGSAGTGLPPSLRRRRCGRKPPAPPYLPGCNRTPLRKPGGRAVIKTRGGSDAWW